MSGRQHSGAGNKKPRGVHRPEANAVCSLPLKSTATAAQYGRLLRLLRSGKRSTLALRKAGILMPAARIKELKDRYGYDIPTVARVVVWDEDGLAHPRVAVYELRGEPEGAA